MNGNVMQILIAEDSEEDAILLLAELRQEGYDRGLRPINDRNLLRHFMRHKFCQQSCIAVHFGV